MEVELKAEPTSVPGSNKKIQFYFVLLITAHASTP
jgi:hypothetical protein